MATHEIVQLLLSMIQIDINSTDKRNWTPLSWVAENGHKPVVKLFIGTDKIEIHRYDMNCRTPLSWASAYGHEKVIR